MRDACFFCHTAWCEHIHVAELVFGIGEVLHLHKAFVGEGLEAVIEPAHADAQFLSQLALGEVGVVLQDAHDPEVGVYLQLGLAAGHRGA